MKHMPVYWEKRFPQKIIQYIWPNSLLLYFVSINLFPITFYEALGLIVHDTDTLEMVKFWEAAKFYFSVFVVTNGIHL